MALTINAGAKGDKGKTVKPGKRLYLTADGTRLVEAGDPAAATLYCTAEDCVSEAEYEALAKPIDDVAGEPVEMPEGFEPPKAAAKAKKKTANKAKKKTKNK